MIISKILNNFNSDQTDGLVFGLDVGLAVGLDVGLAIGLVFGLVFGLEKIITLGILTIPQAIGLVILILIISEILFFFDKSKPSDKKILWFTVKRKGEAIIETLLVVINALNIILNWKAIESYLGGAFPVIIQIVGYLGLALGICVVIYGYFWLNSLRYRKVKKSKQ